MKITDNTTQIELLQHRISILKTRGESDRMGLIHKLQRQIRALKKEDK